MTLESLNSDLFVPMAMDESASVLGGTFAELAAAGTFKNCYTFLNDGSYTTDDKDEDPSPT
jgi:hypothetical protein